MKSPGFLEIDSLSAIEHILRHVPRRMQFLSFNRSSEKNPRVQELVGLAKSNKIAVRSFERDPKEKALCKASLSPFVYSDLKSFLTSPDLPKQSRVLVLDHLQDPQNFGALCRTAEALGFHGVVIPKDRGVSVTPGVYSASVGAVETLPIFQVVNLGEALRQLKAEQYWVVGTDLGADAKPPEDTPDFDRIALVLGQELEGISQSTRKACDWIVQIPLAGKVQSLNVSAAGAILMYHFRS